MILLHEERNGSGKDFQYHADHIDKASKELKTAAEVYAKEIGEK